MRAIDRKHARADALAELGDALQGVLAAVRRVRGREAQNREDLSFAQWRLLHPLARQDELSAASLARIAELTPATVVKMLDQLVAAGIVERTRSGADRRVVHNQLTPAGRDAWNAKALELQDKWEQAVADLSYDELQAGIRVLARLRQYFEAV